MVSKNLKYVLMLSGMLAVAPVTADSGRKLGVLQKFGVAVLGVQADQATFGKMAGNGMFTGFAKVISSNHAKGAAFQKLVFKYLIRLLNAHDGVVDTLIKGTKDALLTGTVEDLVKYFAGKVPSYVKNPALRNSKVELSQTLKMVCAAITAARCAYAMRIAQTALAQVEDECSKLGIESGVQKGLVPADDSYLVIDNPFKSLAMGAKQICTSFDAYQVPNYSELAWGADKSALPSDLINAQNKKFAELVREARAAGINVVGTNDISLDEAEAGFNGVFRDDRQVRRGLATSILMKLFDVKVKANAGKGLKVAAKLIAEHNKNVSDFIGEWTGDTDRVAENEKLINPTQQKIGTALWAPFAITHFVGRTMVPYDTIKQLSPELQQALLDLAAFNTVNFYSFLV